MSVYMEAALDASKGRHVQDLTLAHFAQGRQATCAANRFRLAMPFSSVSPPTASALKNDAVCGALARSTGMAQGLFLQYHPAKSTDLLCVTTWTQDPR